MIKNTRFTLGFAIWVLGSLLMSSYSFALKLNAGIGTLSTYQMDARKIDLSEFKTSNGLGRWVEDYCISKVLDPKILCNKVGSDLALDGIYGCEVPVEVSLILGNSLGEKALRAGPIAKKVWVTTDEKVILDPYKRAILSSPINYILNQTSFIDILSDVYDLVGIRNNSETADLVIQNMNSLVNAKKCSNFHFSERFSVYQNVISDNLTAVSPQCSTPKNVYSSGYHYYTSCLQLRYDNSQDIAVYKVKDSMVDTSSIIDPITKLTSYKIEERCYDSVSDGYKPGIKASPEEALNNCQSNLENFKNEIMLRSFELPAARGSSKSSQRMKK